MAVFGAAGPGFVGALERMALGSYVSVVFDACSIVP